MVTISVFGGPLKRLLIQRAFGMCGQSVTEFELTPEEYDLGLQCMNQIATEFGAAFGFNYPLYGDGNADEESGIAASDALGFAVRIAQEIAPNIGKQFSPNGPQQKACSALIAKYQATPSRELGRQTVRGAGNRYLGYWRGPFFAQSSPDGETAQ